MTIIIIIFLTIQIICGFYFCEIKILIHSSQLIYKLLTYQHINYLSVFYIEVVFMVVIQKYDFFKKIFLIMFLKKDNLKNIFNQNYSRIDFYLQNK